MSAVMMPAARTSPWRSALVAVLACVLLVLVLYRDSFVGMVTIWSRSDTFAHAFLVAPISLWLVWRRRAEVALLHPRPQPWMLAPIAAVAGAWMIGDMAGVNALTQLCATALLVLVVPAVLGWSVARALAFPLLFLFFMVPIGEFLLPVLMAHTADFTVAALRLSGIPVYREGLQFLIPSGAWSVVEACSGVRYLIASFMVGTLFAYLNYSSFKRRLIFCAVSIVVPIIANWLRAYMIVMLGHLSGNTLAVGVDHLIYGWVFFGIVIMIMFMIGARWSQPQAAGNPGAAASDAVDAAGPARFVGWGAVAAAMALLALPQLGLWQLNRAQAAPLPTLALPDLAGEQQSAAAKPLIEPIFEGAAATAVRIYGAGPQAVTVHVAYYRQQGYGRKLVSSSNVLVRSNDDFWNRVSGGSVATRVAESDVRWRMTELLQGSARGTSRQRLEVRQIYWVDGRFTDSDSWATLLGVRGRLAGRGDDGAMITLYTAGAAAETGPRLDGFIRSQLPALDQHLAAVRAAR